MRKSQAGWVIMACAGTLLVAACNILKIGQPADDKAIVSEIQSKFFQDSWLKQRDLRVSSEKGVVTVSGTVSSELEKAAALRLASETKDVKGVIDQLLVVPAAAITQPSAEPVVPTPVAEPKPEPRKASRPAARSVAPSKPTAAAATQAAAPAAPTEPASAAPTTETAAALTSAAPAAQPAEQITIPEGTTITVRMIDAIDSSQNRPGEEFAASLDVPVVVGERVVIPRGSDARVRLVEARTAGRMAGRSELQIELVSVTVGGASYELSTGLYEKRGASRGTRTAQTVGGGAAIGAVIGAIAGGGKGAAIGAAVGAGAGTAVQVATRGQQVKVPSETKIEFTLRAPLTVTM